MMRGETIRDEMRLCDVRGVEWRRDGVVSYNVM